MPGSSIGYYYKELKGAKGDVTALDLKTGKVKWRKEIPTGGVLGLRGCRATASRSAPRPTARCGRTSSPTANAPGSTTRRSPLFAPPAVAGGVVYVADLAGTVHAIDLKTGDREVDVLRLAKETGAPGMVYGGVTVHGGKLVVATCNLEGPSPGKETVVVCIGSK